MVGSKGRGKDKKAVTVQVQLKIKYVAQVATRPPTFTAWANRPDVPDTYRRFLVNSLREEFRLGGTPIRLNVRAAENPFTKMGRKARPGVLLARARKLQATQAEAAGKGAAGGSSWDTGDTAFGKRVEKADQKRAAFKESRESQQPDEEPKRPSGPRPFSAKVTRMAKATAKSGGKVARVQARMVKKMKIIQAKARGRGKGSAA
jgi:GTP-binding protein